QEMLNHLPLLPDKQWARGGWITNLPPMDAAFGLPWERSSETKPSIDAGQLRSNWRPYRTVIRAVDERINWNSFDFIDGSRPASRYHLIAPPDWGEVDLSDLAAPSPRR